MAFYQSVRGFLNDSASLINPGTPTVPLQGNAQSRALRFLNQLISSFAATGLMLTIAKKITFTAQIGQKFIIFADPNYPGYADVLEGRLANLQNAWLELDGVTYPIVDESRNVFFDSYKYELQQGLPRFCIITNETNSTTMQIYPSPSQVYTLFVYGKFELATLSMNDDMSSLPLYYQRYLSFACAKDTAYYSARSEAWTDKLEAELVKAEKDMQAASPINLTISADHDSYLNGSWRVRSGV